MVEGQELTYDQIVDHIIGDKPVPNVVQVPNITLSESLRSVSEINPRPKPWETAVPNEDDGTRDDLKIDLGQSDLFMGQDISEFDVASKYQAKEMDLDSLTTNVENSDA